LECSQNTARRFRLPRFGAKLAARFEFWIEPVHFGLIDA